MYACADADHPRSLVLSRSTLFSADRYPSLPLQLQPCVGCECTFGRAVGRTLRTACGFDGRRGDRRGARGAFRGSKSRTPSTTGHPPRPEAPTAARARAGAHRSCRAGAAPALAAGAPATPRAGGRRLPASPPPRRRLQSEGSRCIATKLPTDTA